MTRSKLSTDSPVVARYLVEFPHPPAPVDWPTLFGRPGPVEIEIGSGKALFLITASRERPDHNFLGIEVSNKYARLCAQRVANRDLANVRVIQTDARYFLQAYVPADSVRAILVYFPDPWWKKRHRKRRVFTPEMIAASEHVLEPGGCVHIVTDVPDYFEDIVTLFKHHTRLVRFDVPDAAEPTHDMDYLTNFERKFRKAERTIHRIGYRKS